MDVTVHVARSFVLASSQSVLFTAVQVWVRAIELLVDKFHRGGNPFETYIQAQWDKADTDRSGTLTRDEVQQVCPFMCARLS